MTPAPRPGPRFWRGVAFASAISLPVWAGIIAAVRSLLP